MPNGDWFAPCCQISDNSTIGTTPEVSQRELLNAIFYIVAHGLPMAHVAKGFATLGLPYLHSFIVERRAGVWETHPQHAASGA